MKIEPTYAFSRIFPSVARPYRSSVNLSVLTFCLALLVAGCASNNSAPLQPPPPALSVALSKSTATVDVGTTLNLTATVANDSSKAGVTWTLSGPGLLGNQTTSSVTYTGPASSGSATVTATAVADKSKSAAATITVDPLPAIAAPAQIPPVNIGQSYSLQLNVTAGTGTSPFTWSVTQGQLPKGLSLDSNTGLISGTAQAAISHPAVADSVPAVTEASTTVVPATVQVADSSTPSQTSTAMLNFDVVGGSSAVGFVYVAGDFVISEYSIGSDGTLTLLRPQSLPGSALARSPGVGAPLVVDSLHRFVYGLGTNEILQYKVAADGTLAEMMPLSVTLSGGSGTIVNTTGIVMNGGAAVYVSSNVGVFAFSVGQDGQLHQRGPPVRPTFGPDATCIAVNPSGNIVYTCAGQGIDSYTVKQDGTLQLLATSLTLHDTNGVIAFPFHLGFNNDNAVVVAEATHLATYAIQGGTVNPNATATGPEDATSILDLSVQAGTAFAVAGDLIVPAPPGGGTNDHLSLYDLQAGLGTPGKRDTGRGPGLVLALAFTLQTGPPTPNPLVYVTNSRDNNVAQCIPSVAPRCTTVAIVSADMDPHGITGFLGSQGN